MVGIPIGKVCDKHNEEVKDMKFLEDIWKRLLLFSGLAPSMDGPRSAKIRNKIITNCSICPFAIVRPNVWSRNYPTHQCKMMGEKFIYTPNIIPKWCPYVIS